MLEDGLGNLAGRLMLTLFRRLIAPDETCVNGYWVYAALDVDGNENYIHKGLPIKECVSRGAIHT
jgi:hypothetical protein